MSKRSDALEISIAAISARLRNSRRLSKKVKEKLTAERATLRDEYLTEITKPMKGAFKPRDEAKKALENHKGVIVIPKDVKFKIKNSSLKINQKPWQHQLPPAEKKK